MAPNGPVLQPAEVIYIFWKRTPDTLGQLWYDGMVRYKMTWYGNMVLVWVGYGMGFPYHGTMVLVWCSYTNPGMGTMEVPLNQRIHIPHRYPKMGDWSGGGCGVHAHGGAGWCCGCSCVLVVWLPCCRGRCSQWHGTCIQCEIKKGEKSVIAHLRMVRMASIVTIWMTWHIATLSPANP